MAGECKPILLLDIWRTCNKIRAAIFRSGLDLWTFYLPLDPDGYNLISEAKFVSVLAGPLKDAVGLSEQEILELTDYFKAADGRVLYRQFCQVIHDNAADVTGGGGGGGGPLVTGLEWEDPYHVNSLPPADERRLMILLTKIATMVRARELILLPHFQDYEIIAKNAGTITISHFSRVLHFLKIFVAPDELRLLVRKFLKDGYTVNYMAFVSALEYVYQYMDRCGITDLGGEVLANCNLRGRALTAALPKLPRPEVGTVPTDEVFGVQKIFHPVLNKPTRDSPDSLQRVVRRIQHYAFTEGVRIGQMFTDFDATNSGRLTEANFRRCLDMMGVGEAGTRRYNLTSQEMDDLVDAYRDPVDPSRCLWRAFEDDIEAVFAKKGLERLPEYRPPPAGVRDLPRRGNVYAGLAEERAVACEDVLRRVRDTVRRHALNMTPDFNDYDTCRNGHVTRNQFRQVLKLNCVLLSDEQTYALEQRYLDELGLNYFLFIKEVEPAPEPQPLYEKMLEGRKALNSKEFKMAVKPGERDIVAVLAKVKKQLICYRARLSQFLAQHDPLHKLVISRENFARSLDEKVHLTPTEVETIMNVFACPTRSHCVEYQRFCDTVEEAFTQSGLEYAPLLQPVPHVACHDGDHNFLNFEERQSVTAALEQIAARPSADALSDVFKAIDRHNCGTVNESEFLRALTILCIHTAVTMPQVETLFKCFSKPRGMRTEFDYRSFINAVEIVKQNWKAKRV